jgi:hypothetical protein
MVTLLGKPDVSRLDVKLMLGLFVVGEAVANIGGAVTVYHVVDTANCPVGAHANGLSADVVLQPANEDDYEEMVGAISAFLGDSFVFAKIGESVEDRKFHLGYVG